jgi:hypothetical protein
MATIDIRGRLMDNKALGVSSPGIYGTRRVVSYSFVSYSVALFALFGCEPRDILLGRGHSDAGGARSLTSEESVSVSVTSTPAAESSSSAAPSGGVPSSSAMNTNVDTTLDGTSSLSDSCLEAQASCLEKTPGTMCQDVLILCRIGLPDGGPSCDNVYSECVDMGYSVEDCEHAAATCEGEALLLGPDVDSTLSADEASER